MKIGVVIPCWNSLPFLQWTVRSIRSEKHQLLFIIVDNGSEPELGEWVTEKGYTLIRNPKNYGVGVARNQGIRLALKESSDFIILSHNDNLVHKDAVDNAVDALQRTDYLTISAFTADAYWRHELCKPLGYCGKMHDMYFKKDHVEDLHGLSYRKDLPTINLLKDVDATPLPKEFFGLWTDPFFIFTPEILNKVGYWDENISQHIALVQDYKWRMGLIGREAAKCSTHVFVFHYSDRSCYDNHCFPDINWCVGQAYEYYVKKWGDWCQRERWRVPFNGGQAPPKIWKTIEPDNMTTEEAMRRHNLQEAARNKRGLCEEVSGLWEKKKREIMLSKHPQPQPVRPQI